MIYVDLNGRCGDQFFQYAFARKIQNYLHNLEPLQLNFYNQQRWKNKICDDSFRNDLCHFKIVQNNSFVDETQNIKRFGTKRQNSLLKRYSIIRRITNKLKIPFLARLYHKHIQKNGIYYEDEYFSLYSFPKKKANVFIRGYFEDYHFYEDEELKKALKKELEPIVSNVSNTPLFNRIKLSESVCVSVRSWAEVEQFQNVISSRMVCDKQYFKNAIAKMKELHPNCTLIIFSDNAEFAKNNIDADENTIFENEGNTIEDKILLMSSCKHFILSNSSFSWWVQYLSNDNEKTVISPNRWYNDKIDNRLINDNWIICF